MILMHYLSNYNFQYGFVFGIFNLAAVISAPIFGKYGTRIGPKLLYSGGAVVLGVCGVLFGFLEYVDDVNLFIGLSYLLRFVQKGLLVQNYLDRQRCSCSDSKKFCQINPFKKLVPYIFRLLQ